MDGPTSAAGDGAAPEEAPPFEASLKRLTEIVQALEKGDLPLEDSLRLFEEGVRLSRASQARLDAAEKRVDELLAVDGTGRARTATFGGDDDESNQGSSGGVERVQRPTAPR